MKSDFMAMARDKKGIVSNNTVRGIRSSAR
jgi:hypothetical protein